jgi:hypothetical protein
MMELARSMRILRMVWTVGFSMAIWLPGGAGLPGPKRDEFKAECLGR